MSRHIPLMLVVLIALLTIPFTSSAQIIVIPDCEENPQHSFCQGQCRFEPTLPWCTPPEPERDPIILIPGITVSQNKKLLYEDKEGGKWKFAFLFNVYKGLIKKLESAGYEEGTDLFVAHYDWRNPASYSASTYLKPIIDEAKQSTGKGKVDVVAHSFGGVVSRAYIQSDEYDNDIDQLITLGSPHLGSADAYVAWEGGQFPEGWFFLQSRRITQVEEALQKTRSKPNITRPESFRTFFPSLHDMLPLNEFVLKDDTPVPVANMTEQNNFLKDLHDTISSIANKGINLFTIASTNLDTLGQIAVTENRSKEDEALSRWRDGQPKTLPPPLNSNEGDSRVLLANAHIGSENITLNDIAHHKIPNEAQDQVFEILGLEPQPSFSFIPPNRVIGFTVLSPITLRIEGPNGEILSPTENTFGEDIAEYDDDLNDPDDPADITIGNPPEGSYTITYTGTDTGEYTIITSYADENELNTTTREGTTEKGKIEAFSVNITEESFEPPTEDITNLLCQFKPTIANLRQNDHIKPRAFHLLGQSTKLCVHARIWERLSTKEERLHKQHARRWKSQLEKTYKSFSEILKDSISRQQFSETGIAEVVKIQQKIENAGWSP